MKHVPRRTGHRLTTLAISVMLIGGTTLSLAPRHVLAAEAAAAATRDYRIAAGPLGDALAEFAAASGVRLVFQPATLQGRQTQGLHGTHSVTAGFAQLLRDSGYRAVPSGNLEYTLESVPAATGQDATLPAVTVSTERSAVTEGTDSYAARAVTIGKTAQTLREIPQSVSVVTSQQIKDQNLTTIAAAVQTSPGVRSDSYEGNERITVRGYSLGAQFDGVPQASSLLYLHNDVALYDHIEILRGPSGLLQGSGSPAGSVNYVRKRPKEKAGVDVAVSAGSWNNYRAELDATAPLNQDGSLRGRMVLAHQDQDSFYDVGHARKTVAYGTLEYDLTRQTKIGLSLTHLDSERVNFFGLPAYADGSLPSRKSFVGSDRPATHKLNEVAVDLEHHFDNGWKARGVLSRKTVDYTGYAAYAWSAIDQATGRTGVSLGRVQTDDEWTGIDASLSGPFQLLGRTHTLSFGYNRITNDYKGNTNYTSIPSWDVLNDHDFGSLIPGRGANTNNDRVVESGVYGVGRFKLADPLTLVIGGRWTDFTQKNRSIAAVTSAWTEESRMRGEFTPYGGLIWDLTPQITWYASYADIFAPQTDRVYGGQLLDPRVGWQVESGLKGEFLDGRLNASLAVFRIREKNRSMLDPDPTHICPDSWDGSCSMAAGLVQSQGWEAEVVGKPMPGWDISASYTYLQAKYLRDDTNAGKRFAPETTPKHMFKLWNHYRFSSPSLVGWTAGLGVQAQSEIYTEGGNRQGGYAILSASLGYRINPQWTAQLNVDNLTDRTYLQSVGGSTFHNMYGTPRNAMLTLRGSF